MGTPVSIIVIDTHYSPCKGSNFAEPDEQALVYLALWRYEDSAEQQYQPAYREHRCCNQLHIQIHVARAILVH